MRKILVFAISLLFICPAAVYALEWKSLHEKADSLSLPAALENAARQPDAAQGRYILGLAYLNLHQDKNAEGIFQQLLKSDPDFYPAQWGIAEVMRRLHQQGSEKNLTGIIGRHPDFSPAYISLAYLKYREMDFSGAANLANQVIRRGQQATDLTNYVRALLIFAGSKGMLAHYGGPLAKVFSGSAVFPMLKKAEKLKPHDPAVFFGLGSFYLLAPSFAGGNIGQAGKYLERAVKADPLFADAYVRLGQFYKIKGEQKKYEDCLDRALKIEPLNDLARDIKSGKCKFICL